MIYLRKNDKNIEVNKSTGTEKLPYFSLFVVPEKGAPDQTWVEVGAFWKARSGKGYSGQFHKDFEFSTADIKPFKGRTQGQTNGD